jgi:hypothetical protein
MTRAGAWQYTLNREETNLLVEMRTGGEIQSNPEMSHESHARASPTRKMDLTGTLSNK